MLLTNVGRCAQPSVPHHRRIIVIKEECRVSKKVAKVVKLQFPAGGAVQVQH